MIDWFTIFIALAIIVTLVGVFGYLAWKINMSDLLNGSDNSQISDTNNDKKKKDKYLSEQGKKKRKDQKKPKRETKDDERQETKTKEIVMNTSEETDDEREESEQDLPIESKQNADTSSKARKRNKNKTQTTPTTQNSTTTRAPPVTHPKSLPKDDLETKQQSKAQVKPSTAANKQPKQNQVEDQEQPFTVVGGNRNKSGNSQQQQQAKTPVNNATQQTPPVSVQPAPQKQAPTPTNGLPTNPLPVKQQLTPKLADLVKALPSSQIVIAELMSALDAFPLSCDELELIVHKISNKQSISKPDWNKYGLKGNSQTPNGQVSVESMKISDDDAKHKLLQHVKELKDELVAEKRRCNDISKEKLEKEREIQMLSAQLTKTSSKPETTQAKSESVESQMKRLVEENTRLNQQLASKQQTTSTNGDASNVQIQVLTDQIKKLSVDNANWEKKAQTNEQMVRELEKQKEDLLREKTNLTQAVDNIQKEMKSIEEKYHKELSDKEALHETEMTQYKDRLNKVESENEQLRSEDIVHVEPTTTLNNEEREKYEKQIEDYKKKLDDLHAQQQAQENKMRQEIEHVRQETNSAKQELKESHHNELAAKDNQFKVLQTELDQIKVKMSQADEHSRHEREKQQQNLLCLLSEDVRHQLPQDNQDSDRWFSSYRQLFESTKVKLHDEITTLKNENVQLHNNMHEIERQLKDIEKTVQSKEESLLCELKHKDSTMDNIRHENNQLIDEIERLRDEMHHLKSINDASVSEVRSLKSQLEERFLVAANSPSIVADESFELVKQPSPSLSPIIIDVRAEQLSELIRSSKEALENQDSLAQQLDKHLNDIHQSSNGESTKTTTNETEPTLSSFDQQS